MKRMILITKKVFKRLKTKSTFSKMIYNQIEKKKKITGLQYQKQIKLNLIYKQTINKKYN